MATANQINTNQHSDKAFTLTLIAFVAWIFIGGLAFVAAVVGFNAVCCFLWLLISAVSVLVIKLDINVLEKVKSLQNLTNRLSISTN